MKSSDLKTPMTKRGCSIRKRMDYHRVWCIRHVIGDFIVRIKFWKILCILIPCVWMIRMDIILRFMELMRFPDNMMVLSMKVFISTFLIPVCSGLEQISNRNIMSIWDFRNLRHTGRCGILHVCMGGLSGWRIFQKMFKELKGNIMMNIGIVILLNRYMTHLSGIWGCGDTVLSDLWYTWPWENSYVKKRMNGKFWYKQAEWVRSVPNKVWREHQCRMIHALYAPYRYPWTKKISWYDWESTTFIRETERFSTAPEEIPASRNNNVKEIQFFTVVLLNDVTNHDLVKNRVRYE